MLVYTNPYRACFIIEPPIKLEVCGWVLFPVVLILGLGTTVRSFWKESSWSCAVNCDSPAFPCHNWTPLDRVSVGSKEVGDSAGPISAPCPYSADSAQLGDHAQGVLPAVPTLSGPFCDCHSAEQAVPCLRLKFTPLASLSSQISEISPFLRFHFLNSTTAGTQSATWCRVSFAGWLLLTLY